MQNGEFLDAELIEQLRVELESDAARDRLRALTVLEKLALVPGLVDLVMQLAAVDPDHEVRAQAGRTQDSRHAPAYRSQADGRTGVTEGPNASPRSEQWAHRICDERADHRFEAVLDYLSAPSSAELPVLLERMEVEEDDWTLCMLVNSLGRAGSAQQIRSVERALSSSTSPRVLAAGIAAVVALDPLAVRRLTIPFLEHAQERVRAAARRALERVEPAPPDHRPAPDPPPECPPGDRTTAPRPGAIPTRSRARALSALALSLLAVLIVLRLVGATRNTHDGTRPTDAAGFAGKLLIPATPGSAMPSRGAPITVEGTVRIVDEPGGVVRVSSHGQDIAVVMEPARLRQARPGERFHAQGRVLGRSRFGPIYVRATSK